MRPRKHPYRMIQWATGNVGTHALRYIIEHPDLELVGLRVFSEGKVGVDAGDIAGTAQTGIRATMNVDALLAMEADCVCYCPLATTTGNTEQAIAEVCALLESGKNVVTPGLASYMYPPVLGAMGTERNLRRIEEACLKGNTSIHIAGASPGFVHDWVPLALTKASRSIQRIDLTEVVSLAELPTRAILCDYMGFGQSPDADPLFFRHLAEIETNFFRLPLLMVADHTGLTLDDITWHRDVAIAKNSFTTPAGSFEAGTVGATRGVLTGWANGQPAITMTYVWWLDKESAGGWPTKDGWGIRIIGDPTIEADLNISTDFGTGRPVSILSATVPLNAVRGVCEAKTPGIKSHFDLLFDGGGYWK